MNQLQRMKCGGYTIQVDYFDEISDMRKIINFGNAYYSLDSNLCW